MGVDIYIKSNKQEFSCRLYWITGLIDRYSWYYKKKIPELSIGKDLTEYEVVSLLKFLEFCQFKLKDDKEKSLKKFDSDYFKKSADTYQLLKKLIELIKKKSISGSELTPKLQGLLKRLENFYDNYSEDPVEQKDEICEEFNEKISLVNEIILILKQFSIKKGSIKIA